MNATRQAIHQVTGHLTTLAVEKSRQATSVERELPAFRPDEAASAPQLAQTTRSGESSARRQFFTEISAGFSPKNAKLWPFGSNPKAPRFLGCGNWRPALRRRLHAGDFQLDRAERVSCRDVERRPSGRDIRRRRSAVRARVVNIKDALVGARTRARWGRGRPLSRRALDAQALCDRCRRPWLSLLANQDCRSEIRARYWNAGSAFLFRGHFHIPKPMSEAGRVPSRQRWKEMRDGQTEV